MGKLLYCDLKRVVRDKLFLITCFIGLGFAIFTPVLYKIIFAVLELEEMMNAMPGMAISAKSMFFQAFLPGGDFGLIMPILLSIIICKDFSYGTIRNKIISGSRRIDIFASIFLTNTIVMCGVMLAYGLVTLGVSLIFFEYSSVAFTFGEAMYLLLSLVFEMLVYVFIAALVSLLCVFAKNVGLVIVMYFGVNFFFTIIGSITSIATTLGGEGIVYDVLRVISNANVFSSGIIGSGTEYNLEAILCILIPTLIGGGLFAFLGALIFNKKDLK